VTSRGLKGIGYVANYGGPLLLLYFLWLLAFLHGKNISITIPTGVGLGSAAFITYVAVQTNWWATVALNISDLSRGLKKNAKTYGDYINEINSHKKNVDKLSKEIWELGEKSKELEKEFKDADNKLRKWKKVWPVLDTLDKLWKGLSIVSDAGDLQNEANKAGIKLTDEEALVWATFQNTISDLVSSNPVDEFADKVWDAAKYLAEKFGKKEWADKIDERKDKLTLWWNVKQVVKFAITTDDKTMVDMLKVYDEMYQEESKNAWVVKKAWAFTKYKVISTWYHFGVMATKWVIKWWWKLIWWVKSWF
jgi:hypothetical protein